MIRNVSVGIDIGTHQVKVIVAEHSSDKSQPRVIGAGYAESKGLRHGYIINQKEAEQSILTAIKQAEKTSGVKITRAFLAVGGVGLNTITSTGIIAITKADSEISDLDVQKVIEESEKAIPENLNLNRQILHTLPLQYKVDGKIVLGKPQGLKGNRLEVRTLFITSLSGHLNDLIEAVQECGVEINDVVAAPLATGLATLTKAQQIAGCVLANIGAETVSIVVFENNQPISLEVFSIGSTDITNDIALGLKIPLEEAEKVKHGELAGTQISKKKLDEIIIARLSDIFDLIENHLKKIGKSGLLPAGIILVGGGSGIATIEDIARASLKLPSKRVNFSIETAQKTQIKDSTWAVAYGLCILGLNTEEDGSVVKRLGMRFAQKATSSIWGWLKQFLP